MISKHTILHCMFPLELPNLNDTILYENHYIGPPIKHNCYRFYDVLFVYTIKWKFEACNRWINIYCMHIPVVCKNIKKNHMENPVLPPFWTNIPPPTPPPLPLWGVLGFFSFLFFYFYFCFSKILLLMRINIQALVIPENKFSIRAHVENK